VKPLRRKDIQGCCDIQTFFRSGENTKLLNPHGKNGFVTATKLGTTDKIFVAATKNFAAATKRFVDRTKHFVVATKCFCYPCFNECTYLLV